MSAAPVIPAHMEEAAGKAHVALVLPSWVGPEVGERLAGELEGAGVGKVTLKYTKAGEGGCGGREEVVEGVRALIAGGKGGKGEIGEGDLDGVLVGPEGGIDVAIVYREHGMGVLTPQGLSPWLLANTEFVSLSSLSTPSLLSSLLVGLSTDQRYGR